MRVCVWFSPFHAPISTDMMADIIRIIGFVIWYIWNKIDIGAIFCHVNRIIPVWIEIPCVTSGSHEWNGASPIFIAREINSNVMI